MKKRSDLSFSACMKMMRTRNPQTQEDGFHTLLPRASEFVHELLEAKSARTAPGAARMHPVHKLAAHALATPRYERDRGLPLSRSSRRLLAETLSVRARILQECNARHPSFGMLRILREALRRSAGEASPAAISPRDGVSGARTGAVTTLGYSMLIVAASRSFTDSASGSHPGRHRPISDHVLEPR